MKKTLTNVLILIVIVVLLVLFGPQLLSFGQKMWGLAQFFLPKEQTPVGLVPAESTPQVLIANPDQPVAIGPIVRPTPFYWYRDFKVTQTITQETHAFTVVGIVGSVGKADLKDFVVPGVAGLVGTDFQVGPLNCKDPGNLQSCQPDASCTPTIYFSDLPPGSEPKLRVQYFNDGTKNSVAGGTFIVTLPQPKLSFKGLNQDCKFLEGQVKITDNSGIFTKLSGDHADTNNYRLRNAFLQMAAQTCVAGKCIENAMREAPKSTLMSLLWSVMGANLTDEQKKLISPQINWIPTQSIEADPNW